MEGGTEGGGIKGGREGDIDCHNYEHIFDINIGSEKMTLITQNLKMP